MDVGTVIGGIAAVCTTLSSLPQLTKCWETGSAGDLSLRMLLLHSTGVALWIGYGVVRGDWIILQLDQPAAAIGHPVLQAAREARETRVGRRT